MRLISQDLQYDIPYEYVVLQIIDQATDKDLILFEREETTEDIDKEKGSTEYFIFARTLDEKKFWTMAIYHTEHERAEALRSLHIARGTDRCYFRFPKAA